MNGGVIQWSPGVTLEKVEEQVINSAYSFYRQNKTATANALGISVRTLDMKLEKYDQDRKHREDRLKDSQYEHLCHVRKATGQKPITRAEWESQLEANRTIFEAPEQAFPGTFSRPRTKSALAPAGQHAVSMPQPKEVQAVLPADAAPVRKAGSRRRVS